MARNLNTIIFSIDNITCHEASFDLDLLRSDHDFYFFVRDLSYEKRNIPKNLNISKPDLLKFVEIVKYLALHEKKVKHNNEIYNNAIKNMINTTMTLNSDPSLSNSDHMKTLNTYYEKVFSLLIENGLFPEVLEPSLDESNFEGLFKLAVHFNYAKITNYITQRKMRMIKSDSNETSTITPM